jgi:phage shock protein PspC (stress-responsive transcriptional regulator)
MKLFKNKQDGMIFGVCAGISQALNIDVRIIRLLMVLGVFASFSVLFWIYLLLGIILPNRT